MSKHRLPKDARIWMFLYCWNLFAGILNLVTGTLEHNVWSFTLGLFCSGMVAICIVFISKSLKESEYNV